MKGSMIRGHLYLVHISMLQIAIPASPEITISGLYLEKPEKPICINNLAPYLNSLDLPQ